MGWLNCAITWIYSWAIIYFTHSNYNNDANIYTFALWRITYVPSQTNNTSPLQPQNVHLCLRIIYLKANKQTKKEKGKDAMTHYMRSQRKEYAKTYWLANSFCPCAHLKKRSMLFAVCCVATMKHEPTKILVLCRISHKQKIKPTSLRAGFVVVIMDPI